MWQAYKRLVAYVTERVPEGSVHFQFIDIVQNDIFRFHNALKYLQTGCKTPLTSINGVIRFYGGIKCEAIYREIMALLF
jgi:hypothetical protein